MRPGMPCSPATPLVAPLSSRLSRSTVSRCLLREKPLSGGFSQHQSSPSVFICLLEVLHQQLCNVSYVLQGSSPLP